MAYKTVPHGGDRHLIVDRESNGMEMRVTANLTDNEFKIELLMVKDCPISKSCVRIEEEVNSICDHVGSIPLTEEGLHLGRIGCRQGNEKRFLDVTELWVEGCPLGKNCAGCEELLSLIIPSALMLDKSHAYVTCGPGREHAAKST